MTTNKSTTNNILNNMMKYQISLSLLPLARGLRNVQIVILIRSWIILAGWLLTVIVTADLLIALTLRQAQRANIKCLSSLRQSQDLHWYANGANFADKTPAGHTPLVSPQGVAVQQAMEPAALAKNICADLLRLLAFERSGT